MIDLTELTTADLSKPKQSSPADGDAETIFSPQVREEFPSVKSITTTVDSLIRIVKGFGLYLMQALAFPVEVLLRYKFGERYLTVPTALVGIIGTAVLLYPNYSLMGTIPLVVLVAFAWHKFQIRQRNRRGEEWYSKCWGIPWIPWERLDKSGMRREYVWEPAAVAIPGVILAVLGQHIGFLLLGSAAALIVKQWIWRSEVRRKILDRIDAKIESENIEISMKQEKPDPTKTKGLVVPGAADWSEPERDVIANAYAHVDPRLQALFGAAEGQDTIPGAA